MIQMSETKATLSQLPGVDKLLSGAGHLIHEYGRQQVTHHLRDILQEIRSAIRADQASIPTSESILTTASDRLQAQADQGLRQVFNLTGTILHTNLGRSELPQQAVDAVVRVATKYSNLEYDVERGQRGDRDTILEDLLRRLTGAEAATVVNNNAAAVLLTLNTLAFQKEVPVSRGELVEIGGSFRIPEVMERSGCHLIEVGATNRTHLIDYENAINERTALLMKVHTSNYKIQGFTKSVSDHEIADLAQKHKIPFVTDLGSGTLVDLTRWGLPYEPTVQATVKAGADVITFSGDKLLGGPQCGIITGRSELIARIKKNPMKRALRVDKMTIAALYEVLKLYLNPDTLPQYLPVLKHLTRSADDIKTMANTLLPKMQAALDGVAEVVVQTCESQIGSGSLPVNVISGFALKITPNKTSDSHLTQLALKFRMLKIPVLGRIHDGSLYFDLRTLDALEPLVSQLQFLAPRTNP